jgi:rhodanese-related sulfurtransferase
VTAAARLDAAALAERLREPNPPRVLDVRTPAEFETAHIPGSYNVPLDTLREHRDELRRHLRDEVVLVCRSGQRAEQAERSLAGTPLANVRVLSGGILGWERAGAQVTRGRSTWALERQVRLVAGSLVLLAVLGSLLLPGLQWLAAAVGAGLVVAALTDTCAMGLLLARMPWNRRSSCDPRTLVAQLVGEA